MKKNNVSPFLFAVIAVLSLSAFIFLNTVKVNEKTSFGIQYQEPALNQNVEEDNEEKVKSKASTISLPGIEAVKGAIVVVKKFIPAS